ncbi:MAG: hypothetical protein Tsb009_07840 [Planctomycetaceae bacterium]
MLKFSKTASVLLLLLAISTPVFAQKKSSAPEIVIAQNGADKLLEDLKSVVLSNPANQKEWNSLKEYLEVFLIKVDRTRPIRLDLILGDGPMRYRPSIPVNKIDLMKFRKQNLEPLGIKTRRVAGALYKCKGAFTGYMRYRNGYVTFAEKRGGVPFDAKPPLVGIARLVAAYDLALRGRNTATAGNDLMDRRTWFQKNRNELEAALKKKKTESEAQFNFRKLLLTQQLNEAERIYAEASELLLGWNTDIAKGEGRLDLKLSAISGTSLDQSIKLFNNNPTHFANIPRSSSAILSARVNHPLDDMRQTHFLEIFKSIQDQLVEKVNGNEKLTAEEKAARVTAADLVVKLLSENVKKGLFDGFVEVHQNKSGKNTAIGGLKTVDGTQLVKVLETLAKVDQAKSIQLDIAKEGDVRIHSAKIDAKKYPSFSFFLGDDTLYIGSSKDVIWLASGENAIEELKTSIKQVAKPNAGKASDPFVKLFVKIGPWLKLHQQRRGNEGDVELRKNALKAFEPGIDALTLELKREKDTIVGQMIVQNDILRFAGNMIAQFTKEQLSEDAEGTKPKK